jgi:hypothetical protein
LSAWLQRQEPPIKIEFTLIVLSGSGSLGKWFSQTMSVRETATLFAGSAQGVHHD